MTPLAEPGRRYTPMPGSVAAKCVGFLQQHAGQEMTCSEIAAAAGCIPGSVHGNLSSAVRSGLVRKSMRNGATHFAADAPPPEPVATQQPEPVDPHEPDEAPPLQRVIPAAEAPGLGWTPHELDAAWHPLAAKGKKANGWEPRKAEDLDDALAQIRADEKTPQEGANRAATRFEGRGLRSPDATAREARSKVMALEGSDSPTGRGINGAPAVSAAPAFIHRSEDSSTAGASPAADGSQTPDDGAASSPAARAGSNPNIVWVPLPSTRYALWSDGTLQIERDAVGGAAPLVLLTRDEVRQLLQYLNDPAQGVRLGVE
jgi:hypothetical protein